MYRQLTLSAAALTLVLAGPAFSQDDNGTPDTDAPGLNSQTDDSGDDDSPLDPNIGGGQQLGDEEGATTGAPGAAAGTPPAAAAPAAAMASTPQDFATMAASSNMFEIESSRIAVEKAGQDSVRQFAQRMIDDHTRTGEEMMTAAQADGVMSVPQTLDPRHQQMVTQLEDAPADQFDSLYAQMQVAAHQEAVALFGSYADQEGALAEFASATLPALEEHQAMAQQLAQ